MAILSFQFSFFFFWEGLIKNSLTSTYRQVGRQPLHLLFLGIEYYLHITIFSIVYLNANGLLIYYYNFHRFRHSNFYRALKRRKFIRFFLQQKILTINLTFPFFPFSFPFLFLFFPFSYPFLLLFLLSYFRSVKT